MPVFLIVVFICLPTCFEAVHPSSSAPVREGRIPGSKVVLAFTPLSTVVASYLLYDSLLCLIITFLICCQLPVTVFSALDLKRVK